MQVVTGSKPGARRQIHSCAAGFVDIVGTGISLPSSSPLSSNSRSKCVTGSSSVAFPSLAMLFNRFIFDGHLAYRRLSIKARACSPNTFSVPWFSSSRKSGTFTVFGSKNQFMPFMFCCCLRFRFDVFLSEKKTRCPPEFVYWLHCCCEKFAVRFHVAMSEVIYFHRFTHVRLHFYHRMKTIFKELELF